MFVKWGAYPRLYSSLYCFMRISDQMTIEKMHPTFRKWSSSGSKSNRLGLLSWFSRYWAIRSLYQFLNENHIYCISKDCKHSKSFQFRPFLRKFSHQNEQKCFLKIKGIIPAFKHSNFASRHYFWCRFRILSPIFDALAFYSFSE